VIPHSRAILEHQLNRRSELAVYSAKKLALVAFIGKWLRNHNGSLSGCACDCTNIYVASEHNVGIRRYVQASEGRVDERYWLREEKKVCRTNTNSQGKRVVYKARKFLLDHFVFSLRQLFKHLFDGKVNFSAERQRRRARREKKWKSILLWFTCVGFNHTAEARARTRREKLYPER
jgi:hypothetical protein